MKNHNNSQLENIILFLTIGVLVSLIPGHVMADSALSSDGMPINPHPGKIYGEEFRSAESPYGIAWGFAYTDLTNSSRNTEWSFEFFLNQAQMDQFTQWQAYNCSMPLVDALSLLVPDQLVALPKDLSNYLRDHRNIVISHAVPPQWSNPGNGHIWKDPCGTTVPEMEVPWAIKDGINYQGIQLYVDDTRYEYANEVKTHLADLGLATEFDAVDLSVSTSVPNEKYTITLQGNTPSGVRKSWTFVLDENGIWHNSGTGQIMDPDMQYVLAALTYVNPPGQPYFTSSKTATSSTKFPIAPDRPTETPITTSLAPSSGLSPVPMPGVSSIPAMPPIIISPAYLISATSVATAEPMTLFVTDTVVSTGQVLPVLPEGGISGIPLYTSPAREQVASSPKGVTLADGMGYPAPNQGIITSPALLQPVGTASIPFPMS